MHRDGRVLGRAWAGWRVGPSELVDPEGNVTSQGQLRAYYLVMMLCAELSRGAKGGRDRFDSILRAA